jgi:drug/metabolite transporter (DMT)-like permease
MPSLKAYLLLIEAFLLPAAIVLLLFFRVPAGLDFTVFIAVAAAGLTRALASFIVLDSMQREDVALVIPLAGTAPIFVALLAMGFLGDSLSLLQWLAILLVVTGAGLISLKRSMGQTHFHAGSFLVLLFAALLFAVSTVTNKYALRFISFWNSSSLIFLVEALFFLIYCLRPKTLMEVRDIRPLVTLGAILNAAATMFATMLSFWAIQLGSAALVSTIINTRPLFVFVYAFVLSRLMPGFLLDKRMERSSLLMRLAAITLIVGGVSMIVLL